MASSVLESSEEKIYGFKLMRLIVDGGTEVLRNVFLNIHPGNLQTVLSTHHSTLQSLFKTKKIITQPQWDKLYPHPPKLSNIQEFDITLLVVLLRNICGLSPPSTGWNVMPNPIDNSREANIVRIKLFRNNFFGHVPGTDVSKLDFEHHWVEVSAALRSLGLNQAEIDRLKAEECGEDELNRVRKRWSESEREIVSKLDGFEKILKEVHELSHESSRKIKTSLDDILSKSLHWCDFEKEIQLLLENYTEGTREWVFQQVSRWLNDKSSDNRAFIISGPAGMGKSTIAAVICKYFPEQFAACHFFQYNNSRYNSPKFLLQSLAWQLSNVFQEYKQNLISKLSGNKGKILDDMNIEGLFSMLFKEAFTNVPDLGKHFLIVIDALDESWQEEKYKLVELISKHFHKLPRFIRFLITTRPEQDIARKFQGLNPMFLEPDDERNLNDLQLYFENGLKKTLEHVSRETVRNLVAKSEGLMLYASFLCKLSEDSFTNLNAESLPRGIEEIYESYFNRLESELGNLGIDEEGFLSLLSVIAVAKQPLPLEFIENLLSSDKDSLSAGRMLRKLISCLSSLLVIKDECVTFFHKSVKDWLVKSNHDFTVIETYGHKTVADICAHEMEKLKQNQVGFQYGLAIEYALRYGIPHMLQAEIKGTQSLTMFIEYITDLEVVHASVCVDAYATLNNFTSLASCKMYNNLFENSQVTIKTLINILRKFMYILKDVPQSFLQHVVNEKMNELSPKASALLMTRSKGLAYFESEDVEETALIGRILTTDKVLDVDISPSEDFVICGYVEGGIELFSLSDFKPLWKISDFIVERNNFPIRFWDVISRCVVFHPHINIIFPGQLDSVLNLEGKFEPGPIICKKSSTKFTSCCYSHDNTKMATNYGNHLTVWNLLDKKKIVRLSSGSELFSILFSANDRFLATTNFREICVYDAEHNYSKISRRFRIKSPEIVVSTFNFDSWYCCRSRVMRRKDGHKIVKHDLTDQPVSIYFALFPFNARAAIEFEEVMENKRPMWFDKIGHGNFFIQSSGTALVFRYGDDELKIFRITELIQGSKVKHEYDKWLAGDLPSFVREERIIISVDGRYIYTSSLCSGLNNSMLSCTWLGNPTKLVHVKHSNTPFSVVTNGVFFVRKEKNVVELVGDTPELWNSELTQRLFNFPELNGTLKCLSVADDLVACIMESQVCFFNVLKREIVSHTPFPEYSSSSLSKYRYTVGVIACGSQYHVIMNKSRSTLLLRGTNITDLSLHVLNNLVPVVKFISTACFSPSGGLLAFLSDDKRMLYVLDILTLKIRCGFPVHYSGFDLEFLDDELLLCKGYRDCLWLINVKTCDILTSINVGMGNYLWKFSLCRKAGTIIVYSVQCERIKLVKLWLPYQRKGANELLEC